MNTCVWRVGDWESLSGGSDCATVTFNATDGVFLDPWGNPPRNLVDIVVIMVGISLVGISLVDCCETMILGPLMAVYLLMDEFGTLKFGVTGDEGLRIGREGPP